MRSIGRKIVTCICNAQRFNSETKEMEDFTEEIYGMFTPSSASKYLQKMYSDSSILVNNIEFEEHYYKMPLETFMCNSEQIY